MRTWGRFWALDAPDRWAIAEAAALLCAARCGLALFSYASTRRSLDHVATSGRFPATQPIERVIWAVRVVAERLPFETACVVQALAADTMLRRRGHASYLRFGVRMAGAGRPVIEAHAWLDVAGIVVLGHGDRLGEYLEMSRP